MANTLRLKRSAVSGRVPATTDLSLGEVAINTNDGRVFLKKDDGTEAIVEVIADDGAGNVGIGQTSPASALHVSGTSAARFQLSTDNTGHTSGDGVRIQIDSSNNLELLQRESANIEFFTNNTERLRIDSSGHIMIGSTTDFANINCDDLQIGDTGSANTGITLGSSTQAQIAFADSGDSRAGLIHYQHTDNSLRFMVNGAANERMRINSSGNVGIGTSSPGKKLDVQGSIRSVGTSATIGLPVGTTGQRPGSPAQGELRFNSTDTAAEIYDGSAWAAVGSGGGATGGGSDQWAVEHDNTITASYTISSGKNVISAGPLTVNSGAVVTVPSGSNWVIV